MERAAPWSRSSGVKLSEPQVVGPGSPPGGTVQQLPSGVFFGSSAVVVEAGAVTVVWLVVSLMMFSFIDLRSLIWVPVCFSFHPYCLENEPEVPIPSLVEHYV